MAAFVQYKFSKGFRLTEEHLRRMNEKLHQRGASFEPKLAFTYKLYREDGYTFDTPDVADLIAEDNAGPWKISRIEIEASQSPSFAKFQLSFSADGTNLQIEGEDRDKVLLLSSEIKEYLNAEVNRYFIPDDFLELRIIAMLVMMMVMMLSVLLALNQAPTAEQYLSALSSSDSLAKLNYLIESSRHASDKFFGISPAIFFTTSMTLLFGLFLVGGRIFHFFYPSNVFLLGKEVGRFSSRKALSDKIFWIVVVGLIIAIIGGVITAKFI